MTVEHTSNCACYGRGPQAVRNHEALLEHNPSCAQCRAAHGKEEMCEVGRSFYLAMLAAMDRWNRDQQRTDLAQLRAQLAAVEKERDEYRGWFEGKCVCGSHAGDDNKCPTHGPQRLRIARDAALARVKALEAALEPTAASWAVSDEQWQRCTHLDDGPMQRGTVCWTCAINAIRARAGLTKERT